MTQEKVTREELIAMEIGEEKTFYLTEKTKLQSTATTLTQLKNEEKGEWKHRKHYNEIAITITRVQ